MRKNMLKTAVIVTAIIVVLAVIVTLALRDRAGEMMKEAFDLRSGGNITAAADIFGEVAIMYPDSRHAPNALYEMGFTYYVVLYPKAAEAEKGIYLKLAMDAFTRLIERYPDSEHVDDVNLYLAEIHGQRGEIEKALNYYEAVAETIDDPVQLQDIYYRMATAYEYLGAHEQAVDYLRRVISVGITGPKYENAHLTLARYYRIAAADNDSVAADHHRSIIELLKPLISSEDQISELTLQEALLITAYSQIELRRFNDATVTLDRLEKMRLTPENRSLIAVYRDRLRRQSTMGRN